MTKVKKTTILIIAAAIIIAGAFSFLKTLKKVNFGPGTEMQTEDNDSRIKVIEGVIFSADRGEYVAGDNINTLFLVKSPFEKDREMVLTFSVFRITEDKREELAYETKKNIIMHPGKEERIETDFNAGKIGLSGGIYRLEAKLSRGENNLSLKSVVFTVK